ncbi:disease resistance protein Pik-2-like [Triticum dicoccoides]|uniref:disease resistance protein Pik-2-like n=1 Tax=Triticum dicoccoides TaxID=85692 RepID=UPI00189012A9|nr:disease resistance protein Pik-2-like [Triticum dicoccoides]
MAEFALGLTKTAVEGTVSLVKSAIEEEADLKEKMQNDLVFITGEFEVMQSFLQIANKERTKNEVMRTWVRQLRNLAFDVEDCVELVVHLDYKSPWWACLPRVWHKIEAVAEIKQLKSRVEDVSQRNTRYHHLVSDSGPKAISSAMVTTGTAAFHMLRKVWEDAGKRRETGDLQELITRKGNDLQVISVWGSKGGDLGTTSIFREVYTNPKICEEFKCRAWVKLKHPFDPDEFLESLLTQFYLSYHQAKVGADIVMKAKLKQYMITQRYLIILEEVSTVMQWDAIKTHFLDSKNGSQIVVSTQLGVALSCTEEPKLVSELSRFSDGHSLCAFSRKVPGYCNDMGELKWRVKCRGVFSVFGIGQRKSVMVRKLFHSIVQKKEVFDGLAFRLYRWVHVLHPFNLEHFSRQLYQDLSSNVVECDPYYCGMSILSGMKEQELVEGCRKLLSEDSLVVITGLKSSKEWDTIKKTFLSDTTKCCIIIITEEKRVAEHCVENKKDRILHIDDPIEGSVFSSFRDEAYEWINNFELVGHQDVVARKLLELMQSSHGVVSVWGIAGVGKSALIRYIYCHLMLRLDRRISDSADGETFEKYSWVDVPHPFDLAGFYQRLFLDFHSDDIQAKEKVAVGIMEGQDHIQACDRLLRQHARLVVIDGLQSTHDWDLIKTNLLMGYTKSCIVVITYEASVARHCVEKESQMVNIKRLEPDVARHLFTKIASNDEAWTPYEKKLYEDIIVPKCGGLPKVIEAVGRYRKNQTSNEFHRNRLQDIGQNFMEILERDQSEHLRDLFYWMQSYFDACSDSLKPCIFYMSVFSPYQNIRRRRLLRRWIAEGYSRNTPSMSAEDKGEILFHELVNLSIVQPKGRTLVCYNGFFHEYIISRPMEDNHIFFLDGHCRGDLQRSGQHLTISNSWDRDKAVFKSIDFSRLRSLTVSGKWESFLINRSMKILRVLDLEDTSGVTNDDLEHILRILSRLKFLSLRGCGEISRLPKSVGGLRQLQTLDVRRTSIVTLPHAIINLQKLQYIRAGTAEAESRDGCSMATETDEGAITSSSKWAATLAVDRDGMGVKVPAKIRELAALHTLGVVNVHGAGGKAFLKELKELNQLRKLRVSGINMKTVKEFFSAISDHIHLESLWVRFDKDKQSSFVTLDDNIPHPPKNIKSLKLHGHVHILPGWIGQLDNLDKVDLDMLKQEDIQYALAGLPALRRLHVKLMMQDCEFDFTASGPFLDSKVLQINCTSSSRLEVAFAGFRTLGVEVLKVHCSSGSSLRLHGLVDLKSLNEVCLEGSYRDELKEDLMQQLDQWPRDSDNKPVLSTCSE